MSQPHAVMNKACGSELSGQYVVSKQNKLSEAQKTLLALDASGILQGKCLMKCNKCICSLLFKEKEILQIPYTCY
jgi:hypothetical protein